ncbi:orotidine 5'-phosphate decarboxylase [Desulfobacterium sp. N47]|uniref:Orotidine 5'-phosphate decarboxylase n=1 Tax=uncultured Desulfobacterium sp. TaxID=201089 RepID=E1YKR0_9BACT|nr:Orotidine 5'-phosphate decarboxylase [uncultured Desulfobacterium sp.]
MTKSAKDYIIFPLDVTSVSDLKYYVKLLSNYVGMFKIGLELFIRSGPDTVKIIKDMSEAGIFLDLKLHDIPETVRRASESIASLGVDLTTAHCAETSEMLKAAVSGCKEKTGVLGVTLLTSVSSIDIQNAGFENQYCADISKLVLKRAKTAKEAGCKGVVCSGLEVGLIKKTFGKDFVAVTPGIRPAWNLSEKDDQKRITKPADAIKNGSDYLVIGRPIRDAKNPLDAAIMTAQEIEIALEQINK